MHTTCLLTRSLACFVALSSGRLALAEVDDPNVPRMGGGVTPPDSAIAPPPREIPPPAVPVAAVLPPVPVLAPLEPTATPPIGLLPRTAPVSFSAGWGRGVQMDVGNLFSLQIRSRVQFQALVAQPTEEAIEAGAKDQVQSGFLIRRMRIVFQGHAFTKKLTYTIQLGLANRDMESDLLIPLRDAYVTWQPVRDFGIRFGQMKVPYGKQRVVSSSALQMVDRSIVTSELNMDRDVGLYFLSEDFLGLKQRLMYQVGVFSGQGRNRMFGNNAVLAVARIQINPFGAFPDHLSESDHLRSMRPRMSIGGGAAYNLNAHRALSTHGTVLTLDGFDYQHYGADLHFKWAGFSLLSEYFRRQGDPDRRDALMPAKTEYPRNAQGYFVQAGYTFLVPFEIVGRWGEIIPLANGDPALLRQHEAGGALNFYFWQHSLKLQTDYFFLWGDDPKSAKHQWRLQAQLFF